MLNEYMKLHFKYLMHRSVLIILALFLMLYTGGIIYSSGLLSGYHLMELYRIEYQSEYLSESILLIKFTSISITIFFAISFHVDHHKDLAKYIVDRVSRKLMFIISKVLFLMFTSIMIVLVFCLIMAIYTRYFTPYQFDFEWTFQIFWMTSLQNISYCVSLLLLFEILPSILIGILPFVVLWYMEVHNNFDLISENVVAKYIYRMIPNVLVKGESLVFYHDIWEYWLYICICVLTSVFLYLNRDIK